MPSLWFPFCIIIQKLTSRARVYKSIGISRLPSKSNDSSGYIWIGFFHEANFLFQKIVTVRNVSRSNLPAKPATHETENQVSQILEETTRLDMFKCRTQRHNMWFVTGKTIEILIVKSILPGHRKIPGYQKLFCFPLLRITGENPGRTFFYLFL